NLGPGGSTTPGMANGANPMTEEESFDLSSSWSVTGEATLSYLPEEHALIICRSTKIIKFSLDSKTVTEGELDIGDKTGAEMRQGPVDGLMYFGGLGGSSFKEVDVIAWAVNRSFNLSSWKSGLSFNSQHYDADDNAVWIRGGSLGHLPESTLYKLFL